MRQRLESVPAQPGRVSGNLLLERDMGILFGTDGIRGVAGVYPLDAATIYRAGLCLTGHLRSLCSRPHILIARDTRRSGPWIQAHLQAAIETAGGIPEICGVLSTPAVSFLTTSKRAHAGVMISASHNPYQDNGIKVFSSEGMKFTDPVEEELERAIAACTEMSPVSISEEEAFERSLPFAGVPEYQELYTQFLRSCVPQDFSLSGMTLVADCAHGALSAIAPEFLRGLGADVHAIHCEPDGRNINDRAGALHLRSLQEEVVARRSQLGVAFDGDADRAMFVDAEGAARDGDDVLYMLARYSQFDDAPRAVVGTVMANLGLEAALQDRGFRLVRTAVGDRYVLEEMLRLGAVLGGEQSGHVIMSRLARTGDGLLTALKVLEVIHRERSSLSDLCAPVRRFPQVLINIPVREKVPFDQVAGLREAESRCRGILGPRSRILLRYSGTEKLARVMVEGEHEAPVRETADLLAAVFRTRLSPGS